MKIKVKIVSLISLFCVLIYIISPSSLLNTKVYADSSSASTIGGIEVTDLKDDELKEVLTNGISQWTSQQVTVVGSGTSITIDPSILQYDIDATIADYEAQTDKPWYAIWKGKNVVNLPFKLTPNDVVKEQIATIPLWDTEQTYNNVMLNASYLRNHDIEAVDSAYVKIDNERLAVTIKEIPSSLSGIQDAMDLLNERVIASNEEVNYLNEMDPVMGSIGLDTANFVSAMLYESALKVNAQILERYPNPELVSYVEPGLDAYVSGSKGKNLRFKNTLSQPIQLKLSREGLNLKMEIYAANDDTTANVRVNSDEEIAARVITRYSNELGIGVQKLVQEGEPGLRVSVYRTNPTTGEEEVVSRDFYAPTNRIVIKSSRQPVESTAGTSTGGTGTDSSGGTDSTIPGIDGDNDGLPDFGSDGGSSSGCAVSIVGTDKTGNPIFSDGSYYDKGGNLITPNTCTNNSGK